MESKANLDRFLTGGAVRNREMRSTKLEIRDRFEMRMIETDRSAPNKANSGRGGRDWGFVAGGVSLWSKDHKIGCGGGGGVVESGRQ